MQHNWSHDDAFSRRPRQALGSAVHTYTLVQVLAHRTGAYLPQSRPRNNLGPATPAVTVANNEGAATRRVVASRATSPGIVRLSERCSSENTPRSNQADQSRCCDVGNSWR